MVTYSLLRYELVSWNSYLTVEELASTRVQRPYTFGTDTHNCVDIFILFFYFTMISKQVSYNSSTQIILVDTSPCRRRPEYLKETHVLIWWPHDHHLVFSCLTKPTRTINEDKESNHKYNFSKLTRLMYLVHSIHIGIVLQQGLDHFCITSPCSHQQGRQRILAKNKHFFKLLNLMAHSFVIVLHLVQQNINTYFN